MRLSGLAAAERFAASGMKPALNDMVEMGQAGFQYFHCVERRTACGPMRQFLTAPCLIGLFVPTILGDLPFPPKTDFAHIFNRAQRRLA